MMSYDDVSKTLVGHIRRVFLILPLFVLAMSATGGNALAALIVEKFEIEGLISPASPKALSEALEKQLQVKVVDLNLKNSSSGWPLLSVEFDSDQLTRGVIEQTIALIEDPAGHTYRVHQGPAVISAPFTDEEKAAMAALGPAPPNVQALTNPIESTGASIARGKEHYDKYCTTCHGIQGDGNGPAAHGITTFPRQLGVWNNADSSADGYLFWFITEGRSDMPPWGVILSENERWDIINYIKTLTKPE